MRRGEIRYADIGGGFGRRPVLTVTATELIEVLSAVTCAPVMISLRGIPTRVELHSAEGVRRRSDAACEALVTVSKEDIDSSPLGSLGEARLAE
jgi:mRNA-degrading endonuclease toxin of MazEF toxin-antitoxin module